MPETQCPHPNLLLVGWDSTDWKIIQSLIAMGVRHVGGKQQVFADIVACAPPPAYAKRAGVNHPSHE